MKRFITFCLFVLSCSESSELVAQPISWDLTGTPSGGRIFCISALASGTLIAGAENSGIFRSTNEGQSWQQTLTSVTLWSFARDSSGNLFAGTYGSGIYISIDDGITWARLPGPSDGSILSLSVAPDNSIYAGTFYSGVFRSTDKGSSWVQRNLLFSHLPTPIWCVASDHSGFIYAGPANQGIYRTSNSGATWNPLISTGQSTGHTFVALNPSVFVFGTDQGIYKSLDSGKTWAFVNSSLGTSYIEDLAFSPSGKLCAVTFEGVFISPDSGKSWNQATTGLPSGRFLSVTANSKGDFYAGADGAGLFRSTDGGTTWFDRSNGITGLTISSIATSPSGKALAGTSRGIYASADNGLTWVPSDAGITSFANQVVVLPDGSALAGGTGIFRSTSGGSTWYQTYNESQSLFLSDFCFVNTEKILAGSNSRILISVDSGKTWTIATTTSARVWCMTASPGGLVLAGTYGKGVYRSSDGGLNWRLSSEGIGYDIIYSLVISSDGYIYAGGANGSISRSVDDGLSWLKVADIPPAVWSLVDDGGGNIYAGTNQGVFRSTDRGKNWSAMGRPIGWGAFSLAFDANRFLYAGMIAGGIFRSRYPVDVSTPQLYSLSQNFPNPFNAGTTMEFTLTQPDRIRIVVYDLLGRHVATVANEDFSAGRHIVRWSPTDLSSGVYFYQLQSSWLSEFRKMILVK